MRRKRSGLLKKVLLALGAAGMLTLLTVSLCSAASGCVTCHTDEDMLEDNLAAVKGKKSAMQSGAG